MNNQGKETSYPVLEYFYVLTIKSDANARGEDHVSIQGTASVSSETEMTKVFDLSFAIACALAGFDPKRTVVVYWAVQPKPTVVVYYLKAQPNKLV